MIVEKSFPRGGVKHATNKEKNFIFGALNTKIKKAKPSTKANPTIPEEEILLETHSAELLNYETIQNGMNIMGMVRTANPLYLTVSLPGRMTARISALDISDAYTTVAKEFLEDANASKNYKNLQELYEVGQIVYGRVQEVKQHTKFGKAEVIMTLKPSEVHAELVHTNIRKGFVFNGAIAEIQEHGYVIESGIKSLRSFLPKEKAVGDDLALGQLVYLKVDKITIDKSASTCICQQMQTNQIKLKSIQSDVNIDYLLPSSIVQFQVTKCLKDGLQGAIMNESFTAYVNEHQLGEPLTLPEDYEDKSKHLARILYVMPLTKLVYLTLNLKESEEHSIQQQFKRGDIIEDARVHHIGTGGVILVLNNQFKGLISYKTMKANYKGNYDQDELLNKYAKKSKHKVRVLDYDFMDSMYICSDDIKVVEEKYFSIEDLKPGDFVTAEIKSINEKIAGYNVGVGKVKGVIEGMFLMPGSKQYEENSKIRCRVVGFNADCNAVYLTNRAEYMEKNCKLLLSIEDAKQGHSFVGTIVKAANEFYLIKFFNGITGILFKNKLGAELMEGQTMLFRIVDRNGTKITLGMLEDVGKVGDIYAATISNILQTGLELNVKLKTQNDSEESEESVKKIVPMHLLSEFSDLWQAKLRTYALNQAIETVALNKNLFSIRDVSYFKENETKNWKNIAPGHILRAFIANVNDDIIQLFVPIRGYDKTVKIHLNNLLLQAYNVAHLQLHPDQPIFVKIEGKENATKTISVTATLTSVWDQQLSSTANYIESYLKELEEIRKVLKKKKSPLSHLTIGDKINVVFNGIHPETKDWEYQEEKSKKFAVVKASLVSGTKIKQPAKHAKQEAIVLWIDYSNDLLYISVNAQDIKHISTLSTLPAELSMAKKVNAKVLLKLEHIFICSLKKGTNPLVYCPIKLHYNDFENSASAEIKEGDFCKLAFIHNTKPIAVLQQTYELWQNSNNAKRKTDTDDKYQETKLKRKKLENDGTSNDQKAKKSVNTNSKSEEPSRKKVKLQQNKEKDSKKKEDKQIVPEPKPLIEEPSRKKAKLQQNKENGAKKQTVLAPKTEITPTMPGIANFFTTDLDKLYKNSDSSSSDDDDNEAETIKTKDVKKKKLTSVEKFKQQREEEARLREIEAQYADPNHLPETVDQFDRLVLSTPNDSKNWINYMVFHLQSAEIDKARAVARRALKAISPRNVDDHLNIWIALLNLEIRYGGRELFDSTLKEALTFNEPIKVYLRVLEILREANKQQTLVEIVGVVIKKFKHDKEAWKAAANAYFSIGMTEKAQQMLHKSLASLPEREHVNTIVTFANLNHRHGCNEMAHTLLDQVVTSYPKRVDVWAQYVDMLVKDQLIDSARSVFERAIMQKIPIKKMRSVFKKYLEFEQRHGTPSDVEKVKKLAAEYVKQNVTVE